MEKDKSTSQEDIKRIRVFRSNKSKYNLTYVLWGDILHLLLSVSCHTFLLFWK